MATPENGIRALGKLLINYRGKDGLPGVGGKGIDTVLETINRWAPSNENDPQAYAASVAKRIGVRTTDPIDIRNPATLKGMVVSIIMHENGDVGEGGDLSLGPDLRFGRLGTVQPVPARRRRWALSRSLSATLCGHLHSS